MTDVIKQEDVATYAEITREKLDQLCILAQLELTEEEAQKAVVDMKKTFDYFGQIKKAVVGMEADTIFGAEADANSDLVVDEPLSPHEDSKGDYNTTVVRNCGSDILESNAPAWQNDMLVVPKTF